MPKSPDFPFNRGLNDTISEMRRPATLPETGWHNVGASEPLLIPFQNNWENVGTPWAKAMFYLSEDGECRLRGHIVGGEEGTVAFTLPEEACPEYPEVYSVPTDNGGRATIQINPSGEVIVKEILLF